MDVNSAQRVRDVVIERVMAGWYQHGGKLPTADELAKELGVHRNTVAKAYKELANIGMVVARRGRGTFVCGVVGSSDQTSLLASIQESLTRGIRQSRQIGVTRDELQAFLHESLSDAYDGRESLGAFVECNFPDINAHIDEIAAMTGIRLEPLHLESLCTKIEHLDSPIQVIFTSLFHVHEVVELARTVHPEVQVVGLPTIPNENSLEAIASIPPRTTVGVVTNSEAGAHRIRNLVATYAEVETRLIYPPTEHQIRRCAENVDILVCTRDLEDQLREMHLPHAIIPIPFHVSKHSGERVREMFENTASLRS